MPSIRHSRSPMQEEEEGRSKLGSHCPEQVGYVGVSAPSCSSGSFSPSSMRAGPSHLCGWNQHGFQEVAPGSQTVTKRLRHLVTSSHGLQSGTKVPAQRNNQNDQTISAQSCSTLGDPLDDSPPGPLSTEFSRLEYWSGLPFPSPGDLPDQGMNTGLLHCRQILLPSEPLGMSQTLFEICSSLACHQWQPLPFLFPVLPSC